MTLHTLHDPIENCRFCGGPRLYRVGDGPNEPIATRTDEFSHMPECSLASVPERPMTIEEPSRAWADKHLIQDGWLCPRCDVIVAPFYRRCEYCGPPEVAQDVGKVER